MKQIPLLSLLALFSLSACTTPPALVLDPEEERLNLFKVTKSENANYVVYDLILDEQGRIAAEPLDVYWVLDAEDGRKVGLNSVERGIYGVAIDAVDRDAGKVSFVINAVGTAPMDVELSSAGHAAVSTTIDGKRARLETVHLRITHGWNPFDPDVEVDLAGVSLEDGDREAVQETIRG